MSDLALVQRELFFDLSVENKDFELEEGLHSAVVLSLFTNRRCSIEELPPEEKDRKGWWGDMFPDVPGDQIGSKLWLLRREKQTEETRRRAKEYCDEALAWMVEEKIAQSVTVQTEWVSKGFLGISISIQQPKGKVAFKFNVNWNAEFAKGG